MNSLGIHWIPMESIGILTGQVQHGEGNVRFVDFERSAQISSSVLERMSSVRVCWTDGKRAPKAVIMIMPWPEADLI